MHSCLMRFLFVQSRASETETSQHAAAEVRTEALGGGNTPFDSSLSHPTTYFKCQCFSFCITAANDAVQHGRELLLVLYLTKVRLP
jgi:hypothetical protein